jgi:hypothetical protein
VCFHASPGVCSRQLRVISLLDNLVSISKTLVLTTNCVKAQGNLASSKRFIGELSSRVHNGYIVMPDFSCSVRESHQGEGKRSRLDVTLGTCSGPASYSAHRKDSGLATRFKIGPNSLRLLKDFRVGKITARTIYERFAGDEILQSSI